MISDLAKVSSKFVEYITSLFRKRKTPDPGPIVDTITETISEITENQRVTKERLSAISEEAQTLLRDLTQKELEQIEKWRTDMGKFLAGFGIDKSCIDEFLASPTVEKLDELKKRFPKAFE